MNYKLYIDGCYIGTTADMPQRARGKDAAQALLKAGVPPNCVVEARHEDGRVAYQVLS